MKILVLSDSHGNFNSILRALDRESDIQFVIHAGDIQRDVDDLRDLRPDLTCAAVAGNNEFFHSFSQDPSQRIFTLEGKRIFLTHGHLFSVKQTLSQLAQAARAAEAEICIFGHTHKPYLEERNGILFFNPGSSSNSYGILEIQNGTVTARLEEN